MPDRLMSSISGHEKLFDKIKAKELLKKGVKARTLTKVSLF
jgi:hypothetical protein